MVDDDARLEFDWFAVLGLEGSENALSSFVAWALREHTSMRAWLLEQATLDPALADRNDWRVVREWFVGGAGNVDILVRNRALGWTFVIEHKVATRLAKQQLRKYVEAIEEVRGCSGRLEHVYPCLLTPSGRAHEVDLQNDPACMNAIQLGYASFIERARATSALAESAGARRCLEEMQRLATPPAVGARDASLEDLRAAQLIAIASRLGRGMEVQGRSLIVDDCTITVPSGARQCISLEFERAVAPSNSVSVILDRAIEWARHHRKQRVTVSVPWPEPGTDAPWAAPVPAEAARELIAEQADVVVHVLRAAGRARTTLASP